MTFLILLSTVLTIALIHASIVRHRYWKRRRECVIIADAHCVLDKFEKYMAIDDPYGQLNPDVALDMALDRRWNSDVLIDLGEPHD